MNRHDPSFGATEAALDYRSGDFRIVRPGDFVRCAVTGEPIPLDALRYWSFEVQEAYASAKVMIDRHKALLASGVLSVESSQ